MKRIEVAFTNRTRKLYIQTKCRSAAGFTSGLRQFVHAAIAKPLCEIVERGIGVNRSHTGRDWRCINEATEIKRTASLRARAGQTTATERLDAHNRTDNVAIDIDVANADAISNVSDSFIKTRMQAESQAIAGCIDVIDQAVHVVTLVAHNMQNRTKHFTLQITQTVDLDDGWRNESALPGFRSKRKLLHLTTHIAHRLNVLLDDVLGFRRDNSANINFQLVSAANGQFLERALEHGQNAISNIFLQAKNAQSRTTLTGTVES